jgi:hypothetical protein
MATTKTAVVPADDPREAALLQAIGFDKLSAPQRELALAIARKYDLDPMLKHLVMIDGRPYLTRDGLLHVAHSSGQFDGIEASDPVLDGEGFWRSTATVYRKDMSRPFAYPGRYPSKGRNAQYGPEMAIKVAEVMALRRAFDVAAPTVEETWDGAEDIPAVAVERPKSLADRVATAAAAVSDAPPPEQLTEQPAPAAPEPEPAPAEPEPPAAPEPPADGSFAYPADGPTLAEFTELVRGVDKEHLVATARRMFPAATKFAELTPGDLQSILDELASEDEPEQEPPAEPEPTPAKPTKAKAEPKVAGKPTLCGSRSPLSDSTCTLDAGHPSRTHRAGVRESWEEPAA